jgi:ankyrin repeat protein
VAEKDGSESINVNSIVETTKYEDAVSSALLSAHSLPEGLEDSRASVTHQIVLGTLHSYVISGNAKLLQKALANALDQQKSNDVDTEEVVKLDSTVVDSRDTNWKTALHYACERKHAQMVSLLINAGSNFMIPTMDGYTPLHICAQNLDDKCLSIILSATHPTRPE